jgi:sugar/nucleoside kinase (ribokinase family)
MGELLQRAKEGGMSTSLDPGGDPSGKWDMSCLRRYYRFIDWFLPNSDEIRGVTGAGSLLEALRTLPGAVRCLAVKAGERGVYTRYEGRVEHFPAISVTVVDTTCAGDCFDAGFLAGILEGESFADAVRLGLSYAAQAVATVGLPIKKNP